MTRTVDTANDVVSFLKAQHEQVKGLLAEVADTRGKERDQAFVTVRRLLAVHETAEEVVVHPRARRELDNGDQIAHDRLTEELDAKETLLKLESLDVDSPEFESTFSQFREEVLAHAEAEEREEFARLSAELDEPQLARMRIAVRLAESTAPTRPHPGVESGGENLLAGPFAAMLDRARDLIAGKH
jgi:hemerythrin superfamily protein